MKVRKLETRSEIVRDLRRDLVSHLMEVCSLLQYARQGQTWLQTLFAPHSMIFIRVSFVESTVASLLALLAVWMKRIRN